ncbi:hypothetical protein BCR34DRAFT_559982 [Clohesyomyces aquaticus]|uniref:Uncharacterized protein n=1 Tax=Clohesyomyces aquaticus TaxID=1231657 RepID=A0A1Y1ZWP0_9PLEO|nr:hypothetical protein BCR34DRAFT_559982 [Clohesyomyces aquaticus]
MDSRASSSPIYAPLESLPLLVVDLLCEYLATCDSERRSLFAFALTSKRCYAVSAKERFSQIHLHVDSPQDLASALARWDSILRVDQGVRHVRCLKITGRMRDIDEDPRAALRYQGYEEQLSLYESDNEENDSFVPTSRGDFIGSDPKISQDSKDRANLNWLVLAQFMSTCTGLKHLVWASVDQIPRCVLDILHSLLPSARLHVQTFSLRSLYQKPGRLEDIDPDEYALLSSLSLFSICGPSIYIDEYGHMDYSQEAIWDMVAESAPNLQSVCVWKQHPGAAIQDSLNLSRPSWAGFFWSKEYRPPQGQGQGRLLSLALRGSGSIGLDVFRTWAGRTDFTILGSLDLRILMDSDVFDTLSNMAEDDVFKQLRKLSIWLNPMQIDKMDRKTNDFLSALRPLEYLDVEWYFPQPMISILDSTLPCHGQTLKTLHLPGKISQRDMVRLRDGCPNLRTLKLSVTRTQGRKEEVYVYETLGSFPRLERLILTLDCAKPPRRREKTESARKSQYLERFRSALSNAAVDAELAQSIFSVILRANMLGSNRIGVLPSFRYLKLRCEFDREDPFVHLEHWVGRSWVCERKRADMDSEEALVREIEKQNRLNSIESIEGEIGDDFQWSEDGELFKPAWEANWPESQGRKDWFEIWHSFPLWRES